MAAAAATYDHQGYFTELAKHKDVELKVLISPYWSSFAAGGISLKKENRVYANRFGYNNESGYNLIEKVPLFCGKSYHIFTGLWKLLNEINPDVIEYIFEPWNISLTQIILWKKLFRKKTKIVFFSHENIYQTYQNRFFYNLIQYKIIEKYNLKRVDGCNGATNEILEVMKKKGFSGKTIVTGDELDSKIFHEKDASVLKKKLKIKNFVIGYAGRLEEAKGVMTLIDAIGQIKNENFTLLICGWSDSDFTKKILEKIKIFGIENKVIIINERLGRKIVDYYNIMDVIVVPSLTTKYWKEQFGRVNIEAMACGTPVIGSSSGGIPEVIGNAGLIFKEGEANSLKDKILTIMKDKKLLKELSIKSIERVKDNFTGKKKAEKSYKFYKKLLNQ